MYDEGTILYFTPFIFPDGGEPKPKYFIVIRKVGDKFVLASLPTSKDHVPVQVEQRHGCIDLPDINFNCYCYAAGHHIAEDNGGKPFAFPLNTYVYGYRLNEFDVEKFDVQIRENKTHLEIKGKLYPEEFESLVFCLKNSSSVKRKFRRMLEDGI